MNKKVTCELQEYKSHPVKLGELLPVLIGVMTLVGQTLSYIGDSLWLDETITAWVTRDDFTDVLTRATEFQGQSPLYFIFPWACSRTIGFNEWALRLPSLLFNLLTVAALCQFFSKIVARDVASYAAGMFALCAAFSPELQGARPYALGVCCFSISLVLFERWARTPRWGAAFYFALSLAGVLYSHYLFALALPLYGLVAAYLGRNRVITLKHIAGAVTFLAILMIPATWQIRLLSSKTSLYSFAVDPTITSWVSMFAPGMLTFYIILAFAAISIAKRELRQNEIRRYATPVLLAWCLWWYPSFALAVASIMMKASVFLGRYALYRVVGEGLFQGLLLCSIRDIWSRRLVFVGSVAVGLITGASEHLHPERWKEALGDIRRESTEQDIVLLWTGLIETRDPAWVVDPDKRSYLLAPTAMYPVAPKVVPLALDLTLSASRLLFTEEDQLAIRNARRIFIVSGGLDQVPVTSTADGNQARLAWLRSDDTYIKRLSREYGGISVVELERYKSQS